MLIFRVNKLIYQRVYGKKTHDVFTISPKMPPGKCHGFWAFKLISPVLLDALPLVGVSITSQHRVSDELASNGTL